MEVELSGDWRADELCDDPLLHERVVLMDLLVGRTLRLHAAEALQVALDAERYGAPYEVVRTEVGRAEHLEWMAERAEWGVIVWGGRLNRYGDGRSMGRELWP